MLESSSNAINLLNSIPGNKIIFKIIFSDAHNPVVVCLPGQIMAQFFATRGELTVLVS